MDESEADTVPFEALTDDSPPWLVNREDTEWVPEVHVVAKPSLIRRLRRRVKK